MMRIVLMNFIGDIFYSIKESFDNRNLFKSVVIYHYLKWFYL